MGNAGISIINYSFITHWVWHKDGWLKLLGFVDGAGALVTVISPVCASACAFMLMYLNLINLSFEHLLSCLLCGLVAITGPCHTCSVWAAGVIGFGSSIVYFAISHTVRFKWHLDDPIQIITIHLFGGLFSGVSEGIIANDVYGTPGLIFGGVKHFGVQILGIVVICIFNFIMCIFLYDIVLKKIFFRNTDIKVSVLDVYLGTKLFHQDYTAALDEVLKCNTNTSKRMLFQFHKYIVDRFACEQLDFLIVFNIFDNYLHSKNIANKSRVKIAKYIIQIIETYVEYDGEQTINVSGTTRGILLKLKTQLLDELKEKQISSKIRGRQQEETEEESDEKTSIDPNRSTSLIIYKPGYSNSDLDITNENVFKTCYFDVWKVMLQPFTHFLTHKFNYERMHKKKFIAKIPFNLKENWIIEWDKEIQKQNESMELADTVPTSKDSGSLLRKIKKNKCEPIESIQVQLEQVSANKSKTNYNVITSRSNSKISAVIFNDPNDKICSASIVIE